MNRATRACSMLPRRVAIVRSVVIGCVMTSFVTLWIMNDGNATLRANDQIQVPEGFKRVCYTVRIGGVVTHSPPTGGNNSANASSRETSEEKKGNVSLLNVNRTLLVNFMHQLNKSSVSGEKYVNPHPFKILLHPRKSLCAHEQIFILIYVHTAPNHFKQRNVIRQTWAKRGNFDEVQIRLIFVMGWTDNRTTQESIEFEHNQYADILQENFIDSYRNLTYKAIGSLKWISEHCRQAKFILKTDDDIFVNIFSLVNHLKSRGSDSMKKLMFCLVWRRMKVIRNPKSKWYIPKSEFKDEFFPQYCSGSAFFFTNDLTYPMYNASLHTPFFWVDDFYMTGLLATRAGVTRKQLSSTYLLHENQFIDAMSKPSGISYLFTHIHNLNKVQLLWKKLLKLVGRR